MRRYKSKYKTLSLIMLIVFSFTFSTIAYSAINSTMTITGDAVARIHNNIRITSFKIHEVSSGVISSYEEFSKTTTNTNVTLPNSDSYIIYELVIANYEDIEMQLHDITGLQSNLTYELINYNLNDAICDDDKCINGAERTIYLKIKYASYDSSTTNYSINLYYEFKEFSNILMAGSTFKSKIPSTATSLVFTDEKPAEGITLTDLSESQDMGVVGYLDGTTYKVSTRRTGIMPEANADSSYMFSETTLININLNNLETKNVINMSAMFLNSANLVNINFGEKFTTENVKYIDQMFRGCTSLASLDLSTFKTSKVTSLASFVRGCSTITTIDLSNFDTSNVTTFYSMFRDCTNLESMDISNFNTSNAKEFHQMFSGCNVITSIDVSHFDTSNAVNLSAMFYGAYKLQTLDISNWDVSKVNNIGTMFYQCYDLTTLDFSNWNLKGIQSLYGIFAQCKSLTKLDLSSWDVSDVTVGYWVFEGCASLTELNLSNWNFVQELSFAGMFHGVSGIEEINLSGWSVKSVTDISEMFSECRNLKSVDISFLKTANVTDCDKMFYNCMELTNVYVGYDWDVSSATSISEMFYNCFRLPNFDSNFLDTTKAYVGDGGYLEWDIYDLTLSSSTYVFVDGMTWEDWVNSDFNYDPDIVIMDNYVRSTASTGMYVGYSKCTPAHKDDKIRSNQYYVIYSDNGSCN